MFRINILLKGRVQNVGFRYYVKKCADGMNINGKVWNNYDNSLEIEAYISKRKDIEEFIEKVKKGPPMSSVVDSSINIIPADPTIDEGFEIVE